MTAQSDDGPPEGGPSQGGPVVRNAELLTVLALARASVRALLDGPPDMAARVRAELRKEAIGLDMKGPGEAVAAAAALRRMLDLS